MKPTITNENFNYKLNYFFLVSYNKTFTKF